MGLWFSTDRRTGASRKIGSGVVPELPTSGSPLASTGDNEKVLAKEQVAILNLWVEDILPHWDQHVSVRGKKVSKKVRTLCRMGPIPPAVRGRVWSKAIGNALHITKELYGIFGEHARSARHLSTAAATAAESEQSALLPHSPPSPSKYLGKEDSMALIDQDLPRTFHNVKYFHDNQDVLREVLQTYACYRPDVGYVQGMSYLAGMLLLHMDPYSSFVALANLLNYHYFLTFFRMDMTQMRKYFAVFEALFADQLPSLYKHFRHLNINPEMYLMDWLLTLFSKSLPLDIACHMWDCYVLEGETFMYRASLGILRFLNPKLKQGEFEECLKLLTRLPQDMDDSALFESIFAVSVQRARVEQLMQQHGLSPLQR
mmetsp:Transcript_45728/g.74593  ORF Transcript_45728/g.74593 Transcript_45728/m.74593 type:complete len:372 (-) Transcript_45728:380-1495(-)|eukprot:CAMPEP_0184662926 /NCGR_PEP_ID=MMETSP0308-20130426/45641_1 /TAXON_ID=38269 /ORGANISM="Gloeochaete witrockiana, Strain SAG 46.84" /LENGTH=371 /DNA_ID=CAMNT_0027105287 /DNA_START=62 /DNA_END=1177 /DNA_ORIENTATION=+